MVQFRYTKVAPGPGATNPPFANASAVATIFPSGDRDSADQIGGDLQPDVETQVQSTKNNIALMVKNELPLPSLLFNSGVSTQVRPLVVACGSVRLRVISIRDIRSVSCWTED